MKRRYIADRLLVASTLLAGFGLAACDETQTTPPDATLADTAGDDADAVADTSEPVPDTTLETTPDTVAEDAEVAAEVEPDTSLPDGDTTSAESFTLSLGGWTMQPGAEATKCVVVRLGNTKKIWVPRIHSTLSKGSHHFVIYRSSDTEERTTPFNCQPFSETLGGDTVPLMISQTREETLELPPDVAFELQPNQMIRLEAHYLNYFTEPITTDAQITFEVMPDDQAPLIADFLFYGTIQIQIPAGKTVTTPWNYYPVPAGLEIFAMTGHTHQLGTNVEVDFADSATAGTSVYPPEDKPFKWSEAPVAFFDPPIAIQDGQGFRFRCTWTNTTDRAVGFGESATKEMCFFWAYYYPSRGFIVRF